MNGGYNDPVMPVQSSFDPRITIRTTVLAAVAGWVYGLWPEAKTTPEVATAVAALLGAVYDLVAFKVKTWFASRGGNDDV